MLRLIFGASLAAALLGGCSPAVPHLRYPDRVDSFCAERTPKLTAVQSIVTTVQDVPGGPQAPSAARIRAQIAESRGVIAHWNSQPLLLPKIAKSLGISGDYVTLGDAAIDNRILGAETRAVFLTIQRPGAASVTLALRAYDMQDVCSEAKRSA